MWKKIQRRLDLAHKMSENVNPNPTASRQITNRLDWRASIILTRSRSHCADRKALMNPEPGFCYRHNISDGRNGISFNDFPELHHKMMWHDLIFRKKNISIVDQLKSVHPSSHRSKPIEKLTWISDDSRPLG